MRELDQLSSKRPGIPIPILFAAPDPTVFTAEVFSVEQSRNVESALWTAIRIMEEKVTFSRQLADRKRMQNLASEADAYDEEANNLDGEVTKVRDLIVCGVGARRSNAGNED